MSDMDLVREYARCGSEEAFATLVARHVNLVYSVAARQVGDTHLAEEITQTVFVILARKAGSLGQGTVLSGWLCRTARFVSAKAITLQRRRQHREQEAYMQSLSNDSDHDVWRQIAPMLDSLLSQLGEKDHNALVLRYFEGRSFSEVSAALGTSEAGAKMRVNRAMEKLRKLFARRGLMLSAAAIAGAVSAHSVQAAPFGLAASSTAAAVQGAVATATTSTLVQTTLKIMAWSKIKTALVVGVIAIAAAGTTTILGHRVPAKSGASKPSFAGYATPEAAIQSSIWAASKGDFNKFLEGCGPEQVERFKRKMAGKTDAEIIREAVGWANALKGYKITDTEVISADEIHLHITAPASPEGLRDGKTTVVMKKYGNDWKQFGDR